MGEKKKMADINEELQNLKQEVSDMRQLNKEIYGITGFLLAFIGICFSFISAIPACICAGTAFVLSLLGLKSYSSSKRFALWGIILGALSLIFSVSVITVTISKELTEKPVETEFNTEYDNLKKLAYHAWNEQNGNSLLVLNEDGTYYWYQDKNNLKDNYTKGVYMLSSGVQDNREQYVYQDDSFYYYQLFLTKIQVIQNQQDVTMNFSRQDQYTLGIDATNNSVVCVKDVTSGNVSCFDRIDTNGQEG